MKSHPMWVRGLKLVRVLLDGSVRHVAPYVGAWIETGWLRSKCQLSVVAPYVGAWIETDSNILQTGPALVAPYVGAWIETA